jgi:large subunit ribosomal protein L10
VGLSRQQKIERTQGLAERLRGVRALYLADFTGLNVQALTQLRRQLREAGAELVVVKNTLARRAVQGLDFPEIQALLSGPTAFVLGTGDAVAPARILRTFAQDNEQRPALRAGVVDRQILSREQVETLAALPPREAVLASIAGLLTAPLAGIAGAFAAVVRDVALLAEEVARTRGAAVTAARATEAPGAPAGPAAQDAPDAGGERDPSAT